MEDNSDIPTLYTVFQREHRPKYLPLIDEQLYLEDQMKDENGIMKKFLAIAWDLIGKDHFLENNWIYKKHLY